MKNDIVNCRIQAILYYFYYYDLNTIPESSLMRLFKIQLIPND